MSRFKILFVGAGLLTMFIAGQAAAAPGLTADSHSFLSPQQSLVIQARQLSERQKCHALNRCRQKYTHCYNKLERAHKVADKDKVCVPPYQKCINATFSGFDFFFTRWFNPAYLDCKQYPK